MRSSSLNIKIRDYRIDFTGNIIIVFQINVIQLEQPLSMHTTMRNTGVGNNCCSICEHIENNISYSAYSSNFDVSFPLISRYYHLIPHFFIFRNSFFPFSREVFDNYNFTLPLHILNIYNINIIACLSLLKQETDTCSHASGQSTLNRN